MTCENCKHSIICIMYEPQMKACKDYKMEEYRKRYKAKWRKESGCGMGRHIWTSAEILRIIKHEIPDRELAKELGVSITAIQIQRSRYKKAFREMERKRT